MKLESSDSKLNLEQGVEELKQIYAKKHDLILEYEKNRHNDKNGNVILVYNRDRSYIAFITRNKINKFKILIQLVN